MKDIFLISDVHLYPEPEEHPGREKLYEFLLYLIDYKHPGELWILGDLFDFWFEFKHLVPAGFERVLSLLRELTGTGWEVNLLPGNHDFGISSGFLENTGVKLHTERIVTIKIDGCNIILTHGDGLGSGDIGYRLIRPLLRSPVSSFLFRLIPPAIAFPLARSFSRTSKRILHRKCDFIPDGFSKWVNRQLSGNTNVVIAGHTHVALLEERENGIFISLGDWLVKYTYCTIEGETGKPELLTFE